MVSIRISRDGKNPYPFRLIGTAASGFYRTYFDKEPTLSQARTKLEFVFMADNRCSLE
jgi:hypothetical protein